MLGKFPLGKPLTIEWVGTALPISEPYHCHGNPYLHGPAAVVKLLLYVSHAFDDSDPFHLAARRQKSRWVRNRLGNWTRWCKRVYSLRKHLTTEYEAPRSFRLSSILNGFCKFAFALQELALSSVHVDRSCSGSQRRLGLKITPAKPECREPCSICIWLGIKPQL